MKSRFLTALLIVLLPLRAIAASLPAYSPKYGDAMAGVIEQKAIARGFAANDPRFQATEAAIGTVLTGAATAVIAASGAPLWVTLGAGALVAGAVSLGINSIANWIFNSDGTVSTNSVAGTYPAQTGYIYKDNTTGYLYGSLIAGAWQRASTLGTWNGGVSAISCNGTVCTITYANGNADTWFYTQYNGSLSSSYSGCDGGTSYYKPSSGCTSLTYTPPSTAGLTNATPSQAVDAISTSDMELPANPLILAASINAAWQSAAAQPGYQGLPYLASDPVTAADVSAWQSANPSLYPTVSDLVAPAVNPTTNTVTTPLAPGTSTSTSTNTAPTGSTKVDLGSDPAIGSPSLESTPTAQQILSPLLNLLPDLRSFVVPSHASTCPTGSITAWGRTLTLDSHCAVLDQARPTLYPVMAFVWLAVAMFIVLGA